MWFVYWISWNTYICRVLQMDHYIFYVYSKLGIFSTTSKYFSLAEIKYILTFSWYWERRHDLIWHFLFKNIVANKIVYYVVPKKGLDFNHIPVFRLVHSHDIDMATWHRAIVRSEAFWTHTLTAHIFMLGLKTYFKYKTSWKRVILKANTYRNEPRLDLCISWIGL